MKCSKRIISGMMLASVASAQSASDDKKGAVKKKRRQRRVCIANWFNDDTIGCQGDPCCLTEDETAHFCCDENHYCDLTTGKPLCQLKTPSPVKIEISPNYEDIISGNTSIIDFSVFELEDALKDCGKKQDYDGIWERYQKWQEHEERAQKKELEKLIRECDPHAPKQPQSKWEEYLREMREALHDLTHKFLDFQERIRLIPPRPQPGIQEIDPEIESPFD